MQQTQTVSEDTTKFVPSLSEVIATKICHDLAGSVGAVNNGIELLTEASIEFREDSIKLIEVSAHDAVTKLMFLRKLFGIGRIEGASKFIDIKAVSGTYFKLTKVNLDWHIELEEEILPNDYTKLLMHLMCIAASGLIIGGNLSIKIFKNGDHIRFDITATGNAVKLRPEIQELMNKDYYDPDNLDYRNLSFYIVNQLAVKNNRTVNFSYSQNDSIRIIV